jgi:hypothetical protein
MKLKSSTAAAAIEVVVASSGANSRFLFSFLLDQM